MVIIYLKIFPPTWLLPPTCLFQTVEYFSSDTSEKFKLRSKVAEFAVFSRLKSFFDHLLIRPQVWKIGKITSLN